MQCLSFYCGLPLSGPTNIGHKMRIMTMMIMARIEFEAKQRGRAGSGELTAHAILVAKFSNTPCLSTTYRRPQVRRLLILSSSNISINIFIKIHTIPSAIILSVALNHVDNKGSREFIVIFQD